MQTTESKELDKFELHLESMIENVKECQQKNSVDSCSKCDQFLKCELRNDYVNSVYNSMSKGDTGGFEF
ncbi:hypothetical protein [Sulfurimonas sp.]|uniref:hypothetical protein n=1 Tax=Sulfurimonas sp. TaxID=2022749 RepID=UPI00356578B1